MILKLYYSLILVLLLPSIKPVVSTALTKAHPYSNSALHSQSKELYSTGTKGQLLEKKYNMHTCVTILVLYRPESLEPQEKCKKENSLLE